MAWSSPWLYIQSYWEMHHAAFATRIRVPPFRRPMSYHQHPCSGIVYFKLRVHIQCQFTRMLVMTHSKRGEKLMWEHCKFELPEKHITSSVVYLESTVPKREMRGCTTKLSLSTSGDLPMIRRKVLFLYKYSLYGILYNMTLCSVPPVCGVVFCQWGIGRRGPRHDQDTVLLDPIRYSHSPRAYV